MPDPQGHVRDGDPLDTRLTAAGIAATEHAAAAGGFTPALTDPQTRTLTLVPIGFVLGPSGMALLSSGALTFLGPLVSVAAALIGVLLGLALADRHQRVSARAGVALLESAATWMLVAAGVAGLHAVSGAAGAVPWTPAVLLGVCACASFAPATSADGPHAARRIAIGDLDSMLAVLAGAVLLALAGAGPVNHAATGLAGLSGVALAIAAAGWLLVASAVSDRERHTFVAGTILLLAGSAAYLASSALLAGLLAGVVWAYAAGPAGEHIIRDVHHVRHPLIVLLLVTAGARLTVSVEVLAVALVYVACRTVGKRAGELLVARTRAINSEPAPGGPATLAAPGIVGIAIAMDWFQSTGAAGEAAVVVSTVAIASAAIDAVRLLARRTGAPA